MLRLTLFVGENPWPPVHGGRVDIWSRLAAFRQLGVETQVVTWYRRGTSPGWGALRGMTKEIVPLQRNLLRVLKYNGTHPPRMHTFSLSSTQEDHLIGRIGQFDPDALVLENWPGYLAARAACTRLKKPMVYRSQNVEHEYLKAQASVAGGLKRLRILADAIGFEKTERQIRNGAALVLDICEEDRLHWADSTVSQSMTLPPVWLPTTEVVSDRSVKDIDVLFAGNLWTPNNVQGLVWFVDRVLPTIRHTNPSARVVFAGSNPVKALRRRCEQAAVRLVPNPDSTASYVARSRVLINPVLSSFGVNVKMLELLASSSVVVATTAAIRGLPNSVQAMCLVAVGAEDFARRVADGLRDGGSIDPSWRRGVLQRECGIQHLARVVETLEWVTRKG